MSRYQYQMIEGRRIGRLSTWRGSIPLPAFFPVTTYGDRYPLDKLVQPFLKRIAPCILVSYHYAQEMKERPELPLFIDSGGFAGLFEGALIEEHEDHACIRTRDGEELHPLQVLEFQSEHGDIGATLDFIIPPGTDPDEAKRRQRLTIQNAIYAQKHMSSDSLILYASLQCWDIESARRCANVYAEAGFEGIAIGGMVPRAKDVQYIKSIVRAVREEAPECAIHVFGCGNTELIPELVQLGADSFDSSSYVRGAVPDGAAKDLHTGLYTAIRRLHEVSAAVSGSSEHAAERIPNLELCRQHHISQ